VQGDQALSSPLIVRALTMKAARSSPSVGPSGPDRSRQHRPNSTGKSMSSSIASTHSTAHYATPILAAARL